MSSVDDRRDSDRRADDRKDGDRRADDRRDGDRRSDDRRGTDGNIFTMHERRKSRNDACGFQRRSSDRQNIKKAYDADDAMSRLGDYVENMKQVEAAERMKQTMLEMDLRMSKEGSNDNGVGGRKATNCVVELPEDFYESKDTPHMYITGEYPDDPSNIFYLTEPAEAGMQCMDADGFRSMVEDAYEDKFGDLIDVDVEEFTEFFMDRYRSFRIKCSYDVEKVHMVQLEYVINADKTYVVIYTTTGRRDARMEEFEESAKTIRLE